MNKKEQYSRAAVITATVAWLMVGALLGFVLIADRVRNLGLPPWVVCILLVGAVGSLAVATVVPGQVRCRLVAWLPFGW
ncbi:hypothetical protein GCM10011487_38900 [Steroidobacter agaridevorans]|uniref:Uncharacterized protein n=1 Tax=Steroidobacter agaridevorans TaxID=2695856 RepID=A0A829YFA3_9GAMM|nr:hypothetical protein [Steroidobacter agaridevorans]GFE81890.1 hypothetical protein GCM10011487_38900 [Steroidobacter agaridevorans]GFE85720.1 hypothetical protein GCM10011488_06740 [Steroidobacter agaridevorans]